MRGSGKARRGRIGAGLGVACAAVAGCALWPAGADAARPAQMQISATGSLTYVWHGDRGAGCAGEGLCGIHGALILSALQGGSSSLVGFKRGERSAFLFEMGTVRVRRDSGSGAPAECLSPINGGLNLTLLRAGGRLVARVPPSDLSGPCAGPLPSDVSPAVLPVTRTRNGGYDLRGTASFDAGPFHGQVISTLVLHPGRRGSGSSGSFTGTFFPGTPRPPGKKVKRFKELVALTYGLGAGTQSLELGFSGDPGTFCETLDDCGAQGRLILSLAPHQPVLQLGAYRVVRSRRTPRQILRDFRSDPAGFSVGAFAGLAAQTAETFSWPAGPTCSDTTITSEGGGALELALTGPRQLRKRNPAASGDTLQAVLGIAGDQGALRTHCPGPDFANASGQQDVLARGTLAAGGLFDHQQTLNLTRPGSFDTSGYSVRRSGSLELHLSLRSARARTLVVR